MTGRIRRKLPLPLSGRTTTPHCICCFISFFFPSPQRTRVRHTLKEQERGRTTRSVQILGVVRGDHHQRECSRAKVTRADGILLASHRTRAKRLSWSTQTCQLSPLFQCKLSICVCDSIITDDCLRVSDTRMAHTGRQVPDREAAGAELTHVLIEVGTFEPSCRAKPWHKQQGQRRAFLLQAREKG